MLGRVYTAVPAAGSGVRMGLGYSKAYAEVGGRPLLALTLGALLASPHIDEAVVAVRPGEEVLCRREVVEAHGFGGRVRVLAGGDQRQDTVSHLLDAAPADRDLVLIHDGARPMVTVGLIHEVLVAAARWGAAIAALPIPDTVKESTDGGTTVSRTLERSALYLAQTPQAFHRDLITTAHRRARKEGWNATDDASLLEQMGHEVRIVLGDGKNVKVTTLDDLELVRLIVQSNWPT
ncbi:MAG: 2-C-methyl-D-erythritol 4-phosphate cytidylyltransferase [bacterium]|nr:MAG: 2-C-methyl-D-erythritol 4-phosphate cytidylyltransferase [bacterium]